MKTNNTHRAVVVGGSIAGLLAARVLADHFEEVIVVERDVLPEEPVFRNGVPQSRHVHLLLMQGRLILEQLFPGLEAEIASAGAPFINFPGDFAWLAPARWGPRFNSRVVIYSCSRVLLDWSIRRRLTAHANIRFMEECDVTGLLLDTQKTSVIGLQFSQHHKSNGTSKELYADLVVDASGRASRMPEWLTKIGYPAPSETVVNSFLGYASRYYEIPAGFQADWKALFIQSKPPHCTQSGIIFPLEGNRWIVTLTGAARNYPPVVEDEFINFARNMRTPALYDAIKDAKPLSPIYGFRKTENQLRHYERMTLWPENLLVLGDAVCAFNPVYGQGLTTAAMGAMILKEFLTKRGATNWAKRFQRNLAKSNSIAWLMATSEDFRFPTTEGGKRSLMTNLSHWYIDRVQSLAAEKPSIYIAFISVLHFLRTPTTLLHPHIMVQALMWTDGRHTFAKDGERN